MHTVYKTLNTRYEPEEQSVVYGMLQFVHFVVTSSNIAQINVMPFNAHYFTILALNCLNYVHHGRKITLSTNETGLDRQFLNQKRGHDTE